jgi:Ca-activated chloride channel homolog
MQPRRHEDTKIKRKNSFDDVKLAAALLAIGASVSLAAQSQNFSSRVEAVRVDVLVTDKGRPVRGLQAADFEILDNGVPQQVDLVSFEQIPLNLVLVFDMSRSVVGDRLQHLREGARALLGSLAREDQAALVTFSEAVVRGSDLTANVQQVERALERAGGRGETALVDAVFTGMMVGESDVGRALLIVFSDGVDTASFLRPEVILDTAGRSGVVVYSVVAGGSPRQTFLRDLSEATAGSFYDAGATTNLGATFIRILSEFRQRYLVSYSPRGVAGEGWHRVDVRVKSKGLEVKARPGYFAN